MNQLYVDFQKNDVLIVEKIKNVFFEKCERRSQILIEIRTSVCEKLILTRVCKMILMKSLAISAHDEQVQTRVHRINQSHEITIWTLSCVDEHEVFFETHVNHVVDVKKIFVEKDRIWDIEMKENDIENKSKFEKIAKKIEIVI